MSPPIKVQRVDFSASDWLGGTATLSLQECGLYIKICALIYVAGGPVTKADVRKVVASVRYETFSAILLGLIEKGKISFENGLIDQKRCERELARARRRIATSSRSGAGSGSDSDREAESASQTDSIESAREPGVPNEIKVVNGRPVRVKGATQQPTIVLEDSRRGDRGRSAPSVEPAPTPNPEPTAIDPDPPTRAEIDELFERTTAALRGDVPKGIRDPAAYKAAVKNAKFTNLVKSVNEWVGTGLDGEARFAAWEVLAAAEQAGARSGMAPAARRTFDRVVAMHRASNAGMETAA